MSSGDDRVWGAFGPDGPWEIARHPRWRSHLPAVRRATSALVPELSRPARVPPLRRLAVVGWHVGRAVVPWWLRERRQGGELSRAGLSRRLRIAAERLGPTYIKLGQIISSGRGIFPAELTEEFAWCRDRVPPVPFPEAQVVIEGELGQPLEEIVEHIERVPMAAASIAQVHRAILRDGTTVVFKVQRPKIRATVHQDLRVMAWLAPFLVGRIPVAALANPPVLVELFASTILEELDFRLEAENMLDIAAAFRDSGQDGYVVPRPHPEMVSPRLLVMERLDGYAFEDVESMRAAGIDTEAIIRTGMIGFMEGAMLRGIFHGDLHAGNLLVRPDGRVALLDYGITARMDETRRLAFLRLLVAASMNDVRTQLDALCDLGALPADTDIDEVIAELGLDKPVVDPTTMTQQELVGEINRVLKALLGFGARMPKPLMLFVKNLLFLDGAIATLAPDLDLFGEVTRVSMHFAEQHGETIARQLGMQSHEWELDLTGVRASFGIDDDRPSLTYAEVRARRELIRSRLRKR